MKQRKTTGLRRRAGLILAAAWLLSLLAGCQKQGAPGLSGGGFAPGNADQGGAVQQEKPQPTSEENNPTVPAATPARQTQPAPTSPQFDIVENTEKDAVSEVLFLLYGAGNTKPEEIEAIAPGAYWNILRQNDPSATPETLAENFGALMENRAKEFDATQKGNPYSNYSYGVCAVATKEAIPCSEYASQRLRMELNQKYGIPESAVKEAATVQARARYFQGKGKSNLELNAEFTVVRIDSRWYVYDRGMFYPELIQAVCSTPGGFQYLMDAGWLED